MIDYIKAQAARFIEWLFENLGFAPTSFVDQFRRDASLQRMKAIEMVHRNEALSERLKKAGHDRDRYKRRIDYLQGKMKEAELEKAGEWEIVPEQPEYEYTSIRCSCCGEEFVMEHGAELMPYCPECGAKMNREAEKVEND